LGKSLLQLGIKSTQLAIKSTVAWDKDNCSFGIKCTADGNKKVCR